jgi:hypothetical protein
MQTNIDHLLTGYTDFRHSQVNSDCSLIPEEANDKPSFLISLIDRYVDTTQCAYDLVEKVDSLSGINQEAASAPVGLQGSWLLSQLPWLTPWPALFKGLEPVKVFQINEQEIQYLC